MPASDPSSDTGVSSPLRYTPDDFAQALEQLFDGEEDPDETCLLFHGGTREERQQALATLTRYTTDSVHQFRGPSLLAERRMQTQSALRKAFDHAAEESALLYFDAADAFFTHSHADTPNDPAESARPTTAEYFFDRVMAYEGVVVIALQKKSHVEWADEHAHLVVRFE